MDTLITLRLDIDTMINSTPLLNSSREVSLTHTNLQRAKAWLGEARGASGEKSPYVSSQNPLSDTIEPQADVSGEDYRERWAGFESGVAKVKDFRNEIQGVVERVEEVFHNADCDVPQKWVIAVGRSILALEEAKMWLGWELDRIYKLREAMARLDSAQAQKADPVKSGV